MKHAKGEVNYSRGMCDSHCGKVFDDDNGYCKHYHSTGELGTCDKVIGVINPVYWCKEFEKK